MSFPNSVTNCNVYFLIRLKINLDAKVGQELLGDYRYGLRFEKDLEIMYHSLKMSDLR